ncbi:MAG: serine--tRNA ligase [Candidatus Pacebacteria bacterium]|jgi:seryl-tRNA synthetase|nr:serine--tRNA ligase [Candidatus Paceibacterota bacterium]
MLDIKFIRENKDLIKEAARKKHSSFDVEALLVADEKRLSLLSRVEFLRGEQNKVSVTLGGRIEENHRAQMIEEMRIVKDELKEKEDELRDTMVEWQALMLAVPNVPDMTVPGGESDAENQEVKQWGTKPSFDFEAKDHIELMTALRMVDVERGTKVHGFRGYFLTGDGARLCFAIWNYALEFFGSRGFVPVIPPVIVRKQNLYGTGHLPGDTEDYYMTQDGDALAGTAEVPLMGMYADEILDAQTFPLKYLGFSPCFRREAGSHSKDTKGLIRVHEFYKFEQVILCEASHQTSVTLHEELNRNTEEFIESLGIPYHTVINCGGDLGQGQVKKYDIELWVPKEGTYREISSASYFHDFQTRRFNIRYRDQEGKMHYAHSLNCTAIPTPRILVSLIENFQQADGSIRVPEALRTYLGKDVIA